MRRFFLSTIISPGLSGALVSSLFAAASPAMAEVVVGGAGYFGAAFGSYDDEGLFETRNGELSDYVFVYDLDITFTATGTSDSGLTFGATGDLDDLAGDTLNKETFVTGFDAAGNPVYADAVTGLTNDSQGPLGWSGSIFVSGDFGTLAMGDTDGAAELVVGDLAPVGLTGLGDFNEMLYLVTAGPQPDGSPIALYSYEVGDLTLGLGITDDQDWSLGAGYSGDFWSVGLGYESIQNGAEITLRDGSDWGNIGGSEIISFITPDDAHQTIGQASITFSSVTLKGAYGLIDFDNTGDLAQYGVSAEYGWNAWTFAAYYRQIDTDFDNPSTNDVTDRLYGGGVSYDLGGGLSLAAGITQWDFEDLPSKFVLADFGVAFAF